jgi:hypothetical protein
MHDQDKAVMYRWISVILGLAVIVLLVLWYSARNDLEDENARFRGDLSFYREEIVRACTFTSTTTDAERNECEDVLEGFSDMLRNYRAMLIDRTGTSTMPTSTAATSSRAGTSTATSTATSTSR